MKTTSELSLLPEWLDIVRQKVESLNYGVVQIVVHEKKVTQIERTEKTRLEPQSDSPQRRDRG